MLSHRGQSIIEYIIIVGIVTVVLYYMGTYIKRSVQAMVKVTADQVGSQKNSDQDFIDTQQGYMNGSNSQTQETKNKLVSEIGYIPVTGIPVFLKNTAINDIIETNTITLTNGGFTPS